MAEGQEGDRTVRMFRGISQHRNKPLNPPDYAEDCRNVIISSEGQCSKRKFPVIYTPSNLRGDVTGPTEVFNFTQGTGARYLIAHFGTQLCSFDASLTPGLIDDTPSNAGTVFDMVQANNIALFANNVRMLKWLGTGGVKNWGIAAPTVAPLVSIKTFFGTTDILNVTRASGVTTIVFQAAHGLVLADSFFIFLDINPGIANQSGFPVSTLGGITGETSSFDGVWKVASVVNATTVTFLNPGADFALPGFGTAGPPTPTSATLGGFSARYSYKNSVESTESSMSPIGNYTGSFAGPNRIGFSGTPPTDPQVDTVCWYITLDGGATWFLSAEIPYAANTAGVIPTHGYGASGQSILSNQVTGSLINNPPPVGKYLIKWNGRVIIINLVGAKSRAAYSGYEQILRGRPEQCYPPNNQLVFDIGAQELSGGGAYNGGVLFFSEGNRAFQLTGMLEDVILSAPVIFTAFLQEMSWDQGMASHESGATTPFGFIWLASDFTVQIYNGAGMPQCLSQGVDPILRRINKTVKSLCRGDHFNYLERDWYVLSVPLDSSTQCNALIIFDLTALDNYGVFIFDQPMDWVGVVEDSISAFHLSIGVSGHVWDLLVSSDTVAGVTPLSSVYHTTSILTAFWRGGYYGSDTSSTFKLFRRGKIVADQPGFTASVNVVNDEDLGYNNPQVINFPVLDNGNRFSVDWHGTKAQIQVNFPNTDGSANMTELQLEWVEVGKR